MDQDSIQQLISDRITSDGLTDSGIAGVKLFRATAPIPCVPAVYDPCVIAIASGGKEAVIDGQKHVYTKDRYLCCPTSMPVKAGTPNASPDVPLFGVLISLDARRMSAMAMEMDSAGAARPRAETGASSHAIHFARWDAAFGDALARVVQLIGNETDIAVLAEARLQELYYAILKGDAGWSARQAFGAGNAIARSISHMSANLDAPLSIDDLASRAGMSRAVFHRKFKQATAMSPIQFVKTLRLNTAAMKITGGMTVSEAAMGVGYLSPSQFSREFKRMYGSSPRQWSDAQPGQIALT